MAYSIADNLRVFAPIVHDIVDVSDKKKMSYSKVYVTDDEDFRLRESYEITGGMEKNLDRGRMDSLTISTAAFESLTEIMIHPFETESFINGANVHAKALTGTHYTELSDSAAVLVQNITESIEGATQEIDRGSLAIYNLGITNYESLSELEVQSG